MHFSDLVNYSFVSFHIVCLMLFDHFWPLCFLKPNQLVVEIHCAVKRMTNQKDITGFSRGFMCGGDHENHTSLHITVVQMDASVEEVSVSSVCWLKRTGKTNK